MKFVKGGFILTNSELLLHMNGFDSLEDVIGKKVIVYSNDEKSYRTYMIKKIVGDKLKIFSNVGVNNFFKFYYIVDFEKFKISKPHFKYSDIFFTYVLE